MAATQSPIPNQSMTDSVYQQAQADAAIKSILTSTWQILDQPPPPTLRDILGAYKSKGDGDRDMLLAMLNAKSAEDQRLASVANLHRSMLDLYNAPAQMSPELPSHGAVGYSYTFPSPPSSSYQASPVIISNMRESARSHRKSSSRSSSYESEEDLNQSRKRRRSSRSPYVREYRSSRSSRDSLSVPQIEVPFPPSPYSSASSHSSMGSPRSRESMAIGSLLSSQGERDYEMKDRRLGSDRSESVELPPLRHENSISHIRS